MTGMPTMKAIINSTIETICNGTINDGTVLLRDGKIEAVGSKLDIPDGYEVIDGSGYYLTPGLVDAHTHIGSFEQGVPESMADANEKTSPVTPHLRILDAITPQDSAFTDAIQGGVTCVQTLPGSANVIGGQGAVIKTHGKVIDEMLVRAPSSMKAALGENPRRIYSEQGKLPSTRMGSAACFREAIVKTMNYSAKKEQALKKNEFFERDLIWESLEMVTKREIPLGIHAHRSDDIVTALRLAEEFNLECTIEHCTEGHLIAEYLGNRKVMAAVGPTLTSKVKIELKNKSWETLKKLVEKGVHVCITTDHPVVPIEHLPVCAALAFRAGLSRENALRCITLNGAEHIGMANCIGSIEKGKDADLVLWNGDPLDSRSKPVMTIINGRIVYRGDI